MAVRVFLPLLQNIVFSTQIYEKYVSAMESKPKINTRISKHYSCRIRKKFVGRAGFILRYSTVFYIFNRSCHPFVQTYFCWTFSCYFFFYLKILRCYCLEFHWNQLRGHSKSMSLRMGDDCSQKMSKSDTGRRGPIQKNWCHSLKIFQCILFLQLSFYSSVSYEALISP